MSHPLLIPSVLMGNHGHQPTDRPRQKKASQAAHSAGSLICKALSLGRENRAPQPAQPSENPTPTQPHDSRPRTRVPAVTSKARTTAPEKDKSRQRRRYPSTMRQRPH